ncbi:hypothetical protein [Rhizosaccharibacter radicis]|uniref:Uncharacterized protein n=1 Tax=Rhizosaccharibacter radicis TaxID=2782605 RepID=A0ABT1VW32_9PROT|nr:hypothetical protein [Acetobacteraceae bacterium KSS12]
MTALMPTDGRAVQLPAVPDDLHRLISIATPQRFAGRGGDESGFVLAAQAVRPTDAQRDQARSLLAAYRAAEPVDGRRVRDWMVALNAAVANPHDAKAFAARLAAFGPVLAGYPAAVFSETALHDAMRTFEFFPSVAKLTALLDRQAAPIRAVIAGLEAIADSEPPAAAEPEWQPATEEAKAAVAARCAEVRRQTAAHEAEERLAAPAVTPWQAALRRASAPVATEAERRRADQEARAIAARQLAALGVTVPDAVERERVA